MPEPLLRVAHLTKSYFGTKAVDDLSFDVAAGTITGLIGPNGSGKSTTIDCISGVQAHNGGDWSLEGRRLTGLSPEAHSRTGLVRTFQMIRCYEDLSVIENLLVAVQEHQGIGWLDSLLRTKRLQTAEAEARARALDALARVNLSPYADAPAQVLSYGQRKLLAIAALIVARPKLAILDEPVSGINPTMILEVEKALRALRAEGSTLLIVEHNMDFLMSMSDHVIVLVGGQLMTQGAPAAIQNDPRVLDAYLGTGLDEVAA
jgi:branched-chain amino acid transport system ATP-binding protein